MASYANFRSNLTLIHVVAVMACLACFTPAAVALTVTFNVSDVSQLRQAVNNANSWSQNDEIIIKLKAGIYALSGEAGEDDNAGGDLDIDPTGALTNLTLERDEDGGFVIIDGGANDRVFEIFPRSSSGNLTVNFNHITIQNGYTDGFGGGILVRPGSSTRHITVNMNNITVTGNEAVDSGGGIAIASEVALNFSDGMISSNTTDFNGGGLYCFGGAVTLLNTVIYSNTANPPAIGIGGGAIFNAGGNILIDSGSTISGNSTFGSGLYGGTLANTGFSTMNVNTPVDNRFGSGSGIFNQDGILTITLSEPNPTMPGDVIIISGTVNIDYTGVLRVFGSIYHLGGDFNYTGDVRLWRPASSVPLLLLFN